MYWLFRWPVARCCKRPFKPNIDCVDVDLNYQAKPTSNSLENWVNHEDRKPIIVELGRRFRNQSGQTQIFSRVCGWNSARSQRLLRPRSSLEIERLKNGTKLIGIPFTVVTSKELNRNRYFCNIFFATDHQPGCDKS